MTKALARRARPTDLDGIQPWYVGFGTFQGAAAPD